MARERNDKLMAGTKQTEFARDIVEMATIMQDFMSDLDTLETMLFANAYNDDAAAEFVDEDFPADDRDLEHLTAADFYAAINALLAVKAAYDGSGNKAALAKAATGTIRR